MQQKLPTLGIDTNTVLALPCTCPDEYLSPSRSYFMILVVFKFFSAFEAQEYPIDSVH